MVKTTNDAVRNFLISIISLLTDYYGHDVLILYIYYLLLH